MAWLILLVVFWKPVYQLGRAAYAKFGSKDDTHSYWLEQSKDWFKQLLVLVKP